jgi:hypothetical protein
MDPFRGDEPAVPQSKKEESADLRFEVVAETFLELFQLLQDYAPVWYTKQHQSRALAAHRILRKLRGGAST